MSQEQRTVVAVILSIAVLIGYSFFFSPSPQGPVPQTAVSDAPAPSRAPEAASPAALPRGLAAAGPQNPLKTVERETRYAYFAWRNWGGGLSDWRLKEYHETVEPDSPWVQLLRSPETLKHLTVSVTGKDLLAPAFSDYRIDSVNDSSLSLVSRSGPILVRTSYHWQANLPMIDVTVEVENTGLIPLQGDVTLIWEDLPSPPTQGGFLESLKGPGNERHPIGYWEGKRQRLDSDAAEERYRGKVYWVGIDDRYFIAALAPVGAETEALLAQSGETLRAALSYPADTFIPGQKRVREFRAYLGPKKREALLALGSRLEESIDYGWFSIIAVPILWLLKAFYELLHNWGLAIIALTIFIKALLNPITRKSMQSMKAMQKLQPDLAKLREKHGDNRERLNLEMMQLFKTHKVNPVGGCLPLLLQMPIYIALYKVLYASIELYHSPFFGYYKDLAAPDPYFIAPILLGIFMVLQQKFTPASTADPMQQKMMMVMPIIFSVFMIFLPAGLVIYIFVNTFMSVVQQVMMQRDLTWRGLLAGKWKKS